MTHLPMNVIQALNNRIGSDTNKSSKLHRKKLFPAKLSQTEHLKMTTKDGWKKIDKNFFTCAVSFVRFFFANQLPK